MTNEELNIKVAELKGWKLVARRVRQLTIWDIYRPDGTCAISDEYKRVDALPAYTSDLNAAFSLLEGLNFMVFTCDFGYSCKIYTAPEQGEEELAEGFADTAAVAICKAFVKLKGVEV